MGTLAAINWDSGTLETAVERFGCPECGSGLVLQQDPKNSDWQLASFQCRNCDEPIDGEGLVRSAVEDLLGWDAYVSVKDGGEPPYDDCPECEGIYVYEEEKCLMCGFSPTGNCAICSTPLTLNDFRSPEFSGLCNYHQYVTDKERYR